MGFLVFVYLIGVVAGSVAISYGTPRVVFGAIGAGFVAVMFANMARDFFAYLCTRKLNR